MALDTVEARTIGPVFPWQVPLSTWQKFRCAPAEFLVRWLNERRTEHAKHTSSSQRVETHPIRIVCISDTHNTQPRVPNGVYFSMLVISQTKAPSKSFRPSFTGSIPFLTHAKLSLPATTIAYWTLNTSPISQIASMRVKEHPALILTGATSFT